MGNYRVSVILISVLFTLVNGDLTVSLGRANVNEWFSKKIEPQMFNLTLEQPDQYEYSFSLKDYPDLPSWMRFMYSTEYNSGFLYGTPPEQLISQEVSGLHCVFTNVWKYFHQIYSHETNVTDSFGYGRREQIQL